MPSQNSDELREIRDLVRGRTLPQAIKDVQVSFGLDSSGDSAVWILLIVDDDVNPTKQKLSDLTRFATEIKSDVIQRFPAHWPYVEFRSAA